MNRDLGRKGSTETATSDRTPSDPEKTTSTSDRSTAANTSEGDRPSSTAEGAGRKERSASAERGVSRERPGSAGERQQGSDREQSRSSGQDRERDRTSGSDRDRGIASDRERDRVSGSGSQKVAVERDAEGERSVRTERKNSSGGSAGGRSVSLDKMSIGEKSSVTRRVADHQEKPSVSSKERGEGSERASKSDRSVAFVSLPLVKPPSICMIIKKALYSGSVNTVVNVYNSFFFSPRSVSKDRTERSVPSGEKPAASHREGNLNLCMCACEERTDFALCHQI